MLVKRIADLTVEFRGVGKILDCVNFNLHRGQTIGVVGESGCGKSMTALSIMRLMPSLALRVTGGGVKLDGEDLLQASGQRMRELRGSRLAMIFQDPMTSLNPLYTVGDQIAESIRKNGGIDRREALEKAVGMLKAVGIPDPGRHLGE